MANFNLNEYDQVEDRIKKFYAENKDGRIVTRAIFQDGSRSMIKAYIYINKEDQKNKCPKATGIAEEIRVETKSVSKYGKEYEEVNYSSWTENCETSAIGRALANMDMSGNKRPSRQEMEKVQRMSTQAPAKRATVSDYENASQGGSTKPVNTSGGPLASSKQISFIQSLGGTPTKDMTVGQAKELISNLLAKKNG